VYKELIFRPLGMKHTYLYSRSQPIDSDIGKPAHYFFKNTDLINIKAFESSWADGGIVSTVDDCLVFIKAFNTGTIFANEDTRYLMRDWKKLQKGMYYGFGTMHFVPPELLFLFFSYPNITGHFGSIGSFLFYCEKLDIYIAGTINQGKSTSRPFRVVLKVINLIRKLEKEKNQDSI
jgi:D-alanyl-D-alanine carboxypeptidase